MAGSELPLGSLCSCQRTSTFRLVSPIYMPPQVHVPSYNLQDGCGFLLFKLNSGLIHNGVYENSTDTTLSDHKKFNSFLRYHFNKSAPQLYDEMTSSSSQPGQLYGIAKTHKFSDLSEVSVNTLKFRPIISKVGTCTYNAAQVIGEYLKPLISKNT